MKKYFFILSLLATGSLQAQKIENIIIITTDGLRWQDLFKGMDPALANNPKFNQDDSSYLYTAYWAATEAERRKKLMPFFWSTVQEKGQIYGNRDLGNKINNANPYRFSYPGYSEMMTGYADTAINSNDFPPNPHVTVLEFLNQQQKLKGSVAAFGAWYAFDRILNEDRSGIPVVNAFQPTGGSNPTANEKLINAMRKDSQRPWGEEECFDVFTHYAALEHLKIKKPKVLYIAYGETDEWAHSGKYRFYLDAAKQVDTWIKQIWDFVQSHPQYKNKTAIVITTDHGRGDTNKEEWTSHGSGIKGADEIWLAVMGPEIINLGEVKSSMQLYQDQLAQTIAHLMHYTFKAGHPVSPVIKSVLSK